MAQYRSNGPRFVDESVDGEALIMDMVTGTYYTCLGPATIAWDALKRGVEPGDVASMIATMYEADAAAVERDLDAFVAELVQEEMLVARDGAPASAPVEPPPAPAPAGPYAPMRIERYTDLADLILLDPVQDVSGAGWPHE
jgi:hypothetical protein